MPGFGLGAECWGGTQPWIENRAKSLCGYRGVVFGEWRGRGKLFVRQSRKRVKNEAALCTKATSEIRSGMKLKTLKQLLLISTKTTTFVNTKKKVT